MSEQVHGGDVPGTGSRYQMGFWQRETQGGCFKLKNNMSKCTMNQRLMKELAWESRIMIAWQLQQTLSGRARSSPPSW